MKCYACSGEITDGSRFCAHCGADQNIAPAQPEPAAEAVPVAAAPATVTVVQQAPVARRQTNRPVIQLPTHRGLGKMFWLGLITCGIYPMVIYSRMPEELNMVASRHDGERTQQFCFTGILGVLTLGIYIFVWFHKLCRRIGNELRRRELNYKFGAGTFWLWNILGSLILVGPFIFLHKLCKAMNKLNADFNEKG